MAKKCTPLCKPTASVDITFLGRRQSSTLIIVKFGSIDSHSPMRGHMGHLEASQGDLGNQLVL
jgi:hypothetical protein